MKKRDLILDFTSLLDVIMIILFVVISNMGQASLDAIEEAQARMEENAEVQQELSDVQRAMEELQDKYEGMAASRESLQKQLEELSKEINLYKAMSAQADVDEAQLYESLMEKTKKITLKCVPRITSDSNEVEITIYAVKSGDEQEPCDVVTFIHNFELTREERIIKNAEMQADMYRALEKIIKGSDLELVLITIEYTYEDKNFSRADMNNILGAIYDIEKNYSMTCYINKVKQ